MAISKHSALIFGHSTSFSLEDEFWLELKNIAKKKGVSVASIIEQIDSARATDNLSSSLRLFILQEVKKS